MIDGLESHAPLDSHAPAASVASAIAQYDLEFGLRQEIVGYGTGELAAVLRDEDGQLYDVRVTART